MANLTETKTYETGIYKIETTDTVIGGDESVANKQARQLANRTAWLKQQALDNMVGHLIIWPTATPPNGYLECDGSALSRTTYAPLFAVLGTTHNKTGDAGGKFRLPDLRGEFIRGWDHGRGVDKQRTIGSMQKATHIRRLIDNLINYSVGTFAVGAWEIETPMTDTVTGTKTDTALNNNTFYEATARSQAGSDDNHGFATRPRNFAAMICVKY